MFKQITLLATAIICASATATASSDALARRDDSWVVGFYGVRSLLFPFPPTPTRYDHSPRHVNPTNSNKEPMRRQRLPGHDLRQRRDLLRARERGRL